MVLAVGYGATSSGSPLCCFAPYPRFIDLSLTGRRPVLHRAELLGGVVGHAGVHGDCPQQAQHVRHCYRRHVGHCAIVAAQVNCTPDPNTQYVVLVRKLVGLAHLFDINSMYFCCPMRASFVGKLEYELIKFHIQLDSVNAKQSHLLLFFEGSRPKEIPEAGRKVRRAPCLHWKRNHENLLLGFHTHRPDPGDGVHLVGRGPSPSAKSRALSSGHGRACSRGAAGVGAVFCHTMVTRCDATVL